MAYNLQTIFSVRDNATAKIKQITRQIEKMNTAMERMNATSNRMVNSLTRSASTMNRQQAQISRTTSNIVHNTTVINNNTSMINNNTNARNTLISAVGRESGALKGLGSALAAVGGAYMVANTGAKAFQATIGAAAKYQHSALALQGMMGDLELTKEYLDLLENKAIKSPVLNSTDMLNNSKAFVGLSKNIPELEKVWDLVERVQAFSGVDTQQAAFSTKELFQGDYVSMMDAIGLDKRELQKITKMDGLGNKINALDKLLDKMGVNQEMLEKMGSSTIGQWSQLEEKAQSFFRKIGESGNIKLGKELTRLNKVFDALSTPQFIDKMDLMLGNIVEKVINVGKWMWKWREPIAWAVGALAAVGSAFVGFGIIAALANPISLIAAGIAGAAVGMKALYDNSETFRGIIDGIIGKAKELWDVFKADGVGGIVDMLFGAGTFDAVTAKFEEIKTFITTKIAEMQPGFERLKGVFSSVWSTISSVFSTVWNGVLKPGLENFWAALQILGSVATIVFNNVIMPGLQFAATLFSTLWSVAGPVLSLLGAALSAAFAVLKFVWDTILTPLVAFITSGVKNAFDMFTEAVNIVGGAFDWVGGVIDTVADKVSGFVDTIKNFKMPDWVTNGVSATVKWVGGAVDKFDAAISGSHYHGLTSVPYDNYLASLHKGEMVLTRQEADAYRSTSMNSRSLDDVSYEQVSNSISYNKTYNNKSTTNQYGNGNDSGESSRIVQLTIPKIADQVIIREEADIEKITIGIAQLVEKEASFVG